MQNKVLIIVGMHRSGTSLIANWLDKCGLKLGENMLGPGHANVEGHFEDTEFVKVHSEILTDNHLPWSGLTDQRDMNISVYNREKLKSIIKIKNNLFEQWGWKDPRTCLFLDTYRELIPNAKYLVILRDYRYVVSSLLVRDFKDVVDRKYMSRKYFDRLLWMNFRRKRRQEKFHRSNAEKFLKVWIAYNEEILKSIRSLPQNDYLVLDYNVLNENDTNAYTHLTENWGFSLKYFNFKDVFKEKLINKPIDVEALIADKALIDKTLKLEHELKNYMIIPQL